MVIANVTSAKACASCGTLSTTWFCQHCGGTQMVSIGDGQPTVFETQFEWGSEDEED